MNMLCQVVPPVLAEQHLSLIEMLEREKFLSPLTGKPDLACLLGYVSFLSQVTAAAVEAFKQHQWRQFDALVGETACQLRAATIQNLADLYLNSSAWQQEIEKVQQRANSLLKQLPCVKAEVEKLIPSNREFKKIYGNSVAALTVCKEKGWLQPLSENMRFVIESYFLTQTKKLNDKKDCFYQLDDKTSIERFERFNCS